MQGPTKEHSLILTAKSFFSTHWGRIWIKIGAIFISRVPQFERNARCIGAITAWRDRENNRISFCRNPTKDSSLVFTDKPFYFTFLGSYLNRIGAIFISGVPQFERNIHCIDATSAWRDREYNRVWQVLNISQVE